MKGGNFSNGLLEICYAMLADTTTFEEEREREGLSDLQGPKHYWRCGSFVVYQQGQIVVGLFPISLYLSLLYVCFLSLCIRRGKKEEKI